MSLTPENQPFFAQNLFKNSIFWRSKPYFFTCWVVLWLNNSSFDLWHASSWEVNTFLFIFYALLHYFWVFVVESLKSIRCFFPLISDWAGTPVKDIWSLWLFSLGFLKVIVLWTPCFCVNCLIFLCYLLSSICFLLQSHQEGVCCVCKIWSYLSESPWSEKVVDRRSLCIGLVIIFILTKDTF